MSNKLGRHLYKHGMCAGWTEYRYGADYAPVTLAGPKPVHKPMFKGQERNGLKVRVMAILRRWRDTPFENEAACRHGLRIALCEKGHAWVRSDTEAAELVRDGLQAIGARRPTAEEAQRFHTTGPDQCKWCLGAMDNEEKLKNKNFCSVDCARMARANYHRESNDYVGATVRSAARLISKAEAPTRDCAYCGEPYHADVENSRFCSTQCASRWQKGDLLLKDIECEGCGKVGKPAHRGSKFCSRTCASLTARARERGELATIERQCGVCTEDFTPKTKGQLYCSTRCASKAANRAYRDRKGRAEYHLVCKCCGEGFVAKMPWATYCTPECRTVVTRLETGTTKRLSPPVFDYVLRSQGARITEARVTNALFEMV